MSDRHWLVGESGMTRVFTEAGEDRPRDRDRSVPNRVTQVRRRDRRLSRRAGRLRRSARLALTKPLAGHYAKAGSRRARRSCEFRLGDGEGEEPGCRRRNQGRSVPGRPDRRRHRHHHRQGLRRRHEAPNFGGCLRRTVTRVSHRAPGSIGQRQTPGRVFKGKRMSGHMGDERRTIENLEVVRVDAERNLLLIRVRCRARRAASHRASVRQGSSAGARKATLTADQEVRHRRAMKLKLVSRRLPGTEIQVSDATFARDLQRIAGPPGRHRLSARPAAPAPRRRRQGGSARRRHQAVEPEGHRPARAGSIRSPIWVGGGRAFAARRAISRRRSTARCIALRMQAMLSELVRQERLVVVNGFELEARRPKCSCRSSRS